ncbi:MAG: hypothetical protein AAF483_23580 [Planctomycetota bacterium]
MRVVLVLASKQFDSSLDEQGDLFAAEDRKSGEPEDFVGIWQEEHER